MKSVSARRPVVGHSVCKVKLWLHVDIHLEASVLRTSKAFFIYTYLIPSRAPSLIQSRISYLATLVNPRDSSRGTDYPN